MSNSLEHHARQTRFIIQDSNGFRSLKLPQQWPAQRYTQNSELTSQIQQAYERGQRILLLVEESHFGPTLKLLRQNFSKQVRAHIGIVVPSERPSNFLIANNTVPELLDVIPSKGLNQAPDFYLYKAIRQLLRKEERERRRITQETLETLTRIFITLSAEKDPQTLLSSILAEAIDITSASEGTLYITKEVDGEIFLKLRIRKGETDQITIEPVDFKADESSVCGYVVLTGKLFNIHDVDNMSPHILPMLNVEIDHYRDNQSTSFLTIPLKNNRNEIIAVLQLVNRKESAVLPFETEDESILVSLSTQAAICLENVQLYSDIQKLFDGFAKASITAIESRDPSTAGHSERVAKMTVALARSVSNVQEGIYRSVVFKEQEMRELEYAALLHDFGKIGVREEVLVKAKKLYPHQMKLIQERFKICKAAIRINLFERRLREGKSSEEAERDYQARIDELDQYWQTIQTANQPTILPKEKIVLLNNIHAEKIVLSDGMEFDLLTDEEYDALAIAQGSLTERERIEVESHVRHTYQFLKMIPWTRDFRNLPEIAYCHHEKLDGSGYPRSLISHEIPLQSKVMTIADIYDALTAADRWYKDAVSPEKALDILTMDAKEGRIDPLLFDIFLEKKIYLITHPSVRRAI